MDLFALGREETHNQRVGDSSPDGSRWALTLDPTLRVIHMGDINELRNIVAGASLQDARGRS